MKKKIYTSCILGTISLCLAAQIIHVPADYSSIQTCIDNANDGDTILVDQGTYYENINFLGKAITLASKFIEDGDTSHISNTIIDGSQPINPDLGTIITMDSGEDTTSVICGFTITGGTGTYFPAYNDCAGGAILCLYSGAKIIHNYIEHNSVNSPTIGYGGAIEQYGDHYIILKNNRIRHNENNGNSGAFGGAFEISGRAIIIDNVFANNTCNSSTGESGGAALSLSCYNLGWDSEIKVSNNTFYGNIATCGEVAVGGALWVTSVHGIISNNTIKSNQINAGSFGYGAGIMLSATDTNLLLEGNIIKSNDYFFGSSLGGGICIYLAKAKLINNVIRDNYSSYGGGLAIIDTVHFGTTTYPSVLINNTITNNYASEEGGGLLIETAEAIIFNTIIWGNEALAGAEIFEDSSSLVVQYSDIGGNDVWPGEGNILCDPEFEDDSCHLLWNSLCIGRGVESVEVDGEIYSCPEHDFENELRPQQLYVDIGADESPYVMVGIKEKNKTITEINIFPNPVIISANIQYTVCSTQYTNLTLYDTYGRIVETLVDEEQPPGEYNVTWNAERLPSGVYLYKLTAGYRVTSGKIIKH